MKEVIKDIISLWENVFGDDKDFIILFLEKFYTEGNCILKYDNAGKLVGMAFLPVFNSSNGLRTGYLYAVAVDPIYRNRGIASEMIIELFNKNICDIIATIPASESLRLWYSDRFGFVYPDTEISIIENVDFDLGTGNKDDDIFMIRILNLHKYLCKYAELNDKFDGEINVSDKLLSWNTGRYKLAKGCVSKEICNFEENCTEINLISHKFKLNL